MDMTDIERINELYHKQKAGTLTPAEKEEQTRLRQEYIAAVRRNLRGNLDNMEIEYPDGRVENVKDRYKGSRKKMH